MSRTRLIVATFVLSGAAGLIYEVVWARQLVLVFGNTTQAVSAILVGFFGGLAVGSAFGGRLADRVRRPLRLFAMLELTLAAVVLVTPLTFDLIHETYRSVFSGLEDKPAALTSIRFVLALLAVGPATVLMGATLPCLTRALAWRSGGMAASFGRLYAANTAGAIFGTVAAGFVLIELLGLSGTLFVGAACSASAGIFGLILDYGQHTSEASGTGDMGFSEPGTSQSRPRLGLLILTGFISGVTSLGYQVLWTRLLASGTGNSTYVFAAILAVFLTGLALGAIAFGWYRSRIEDTMSFIAHGQIVVAILVSIGMAVGVRGQNTGLLTVGEEFAPLFLSFLTSVAIVVLPATFVMGLTFPAIATLVGQRDRVGTNAGILLSANTTGSIAGIVVVPFVLVPAIGSPASMAVLALLNAGFGLALAVSGQVRAPMPRLVVAVSGLVVCGGIALLLGVGRVFVDPSVARIREYATLFESREDQIASVQAGKHGPRQLWVTGTSMTVLTVDAHLMTMLPLALRPQAKSALVVAFGMGTSYRTALVAGLKVDAVELVPSVPKMFHWFYEDAPSVMANPNGRVLISDGRNHVELTNRTYDIVITDPPPPIESAGVSVIASREYYEAGKARLNPGGVMMQWLPYGQTLDEFKAQLRTFRSVFEHMVVAEGPGHHGFFLFGSTAPLAFDGDAVNSVLNRPGVTEDISSAGDSPAQTRSEWAALIPALVRLSGEEIDRFTGPGPLITDDRPMPEYFLLRHLRAGTPRMMSLSDIPG